ncbi:dienelactone hydrolase family protein [Halohasta salina]|uniref:dienelactone hydrolase family protein n=1 Tax=Halohasta salina TaxID=2961621 RepID=UPI0020A3F9A6|nr:dienelactone hydrolase family protein [Halohasta salina]
MAQHTESRVEIELDDVTLDGKLAVPDDAPGIVVFAHGSGSSRHSPRNNYVAEVIRSRGLGTLLFDLLTEAEDRVRANRFDIPLLTDRLVGAVDWLDAREAATGSAVGLFGSSTGAAAALQAAARMEDIDAVVSRGGRVDMASDVFADVESPTLLIVGGDDTQVLDLNREADAQLACETELHVVAGAGHLFSGEGELAEVADVAADWFAAELR